MACGMFNSWYAECSTVSMFADMPNVQQLACVGMQDVGASWSEDSRSPEFRNLAASRRVVSLFVHLDVFEAFSVNFEEGPCVPERREFVCPFGRFRSFVCQLRGGTVCGMCNSWHAECPTVGMRNVQQLAFLPTCRMSNSWPVSECRMWERSPTAQSH